jgi:hypothetical protein
MKTHLARKALMTLGAVCFAFLLPVETFSWNQATHAYIANRLGARAGYDNLNEMWGSVAPDMYNFVFDPTLCPGWIADQTQGTYAETFLKVWDAAGTNAEEALAYGFVSHNEQWGADHTAHEACLICGQPGGYIIVKAKLLLTTPVNPAAPQRTFGEAFAALGMGPDEGLLIAHLITEYAVDIRLTNEVAPRLGRKLATTARSDTRGFPPLLVKAFAADYAAYCFGGDLTTAAPVLTSVEKGHRKDMIFLGQAISQPEPVAEQLLAEQVVGILPDFLGKPLPVTDEVAVGIMKAAIAAAVSLSDDYRAEIEATIEFVGNSLKDHGIIHITKAAAENQEATAPNGKKEKTP